jgi:hypothetical protein
LDEEGYKAAAECSQQRRYEIKQNKLQQAKEKREASAKAEYEVERLFELERIDQMFSTKKRRVNESNN